MRLRIRDRDYAADGSGGFAGVDGTEAVLEQALFRLTARRGGFSPIPELGSRLYLLGRVKPEARDAMARTYAQEALAPMGVQVTNVQVKEYGTDALLVTATLLYQGKSQELEAVIR